LEPDTEDKTIRCVIELANTPFDLASFRQVWDRFGASCVPDDSDKFGFSVLIGQGYPLLVDPLGSESSR
jgi:hypothetical protein